jgi:starvation-inducible DNA-binding protein
MTHNFHWNVTGPHVQQPAPDVHGQYTEQWNALDIIAERIRALGHPAPGTYKEFVKLRLDQGGRRNPEGNGHGSSPGCRAGSHGAHRAQAVPGG